MRPTDDGQALRGRRLDLRVINYDEALRPRGVAPRVNQDGLCTAVCEGAPCSSGEADLEPPTAM